MKGFNIFNSIRAKTNRESDFISNISLIRSEGQTKDNSGEIKTLNILWLYPDIMNIHGGRGDVMGLLNMCNYLGVPVEIRRIDRLEDEVDWSWVHLVYITAGELNCVPSVIDALSRQKEDLEAFVKLNRTFIANGSSGAVLADEIRYKDGRVVKGLGLLKMIWTERDSVWGDDIWVKADIYKNEEVSGGIEVIGNQIQVADVELSEGQKPFGRLVYGRGNNGSLANGGSGFEGARTKNIIYTCVLGPLMTKNPLFAADLLLKAAEREGIEIKGVTGKEITEIFTDNTEGFELESKSAECIKTFMKEKM